MSAVLIQDRGKPDGWADAVLRFNLFDGDFGDGSERVLVNELRVAKRRGTCRECGQPIVAGQLVRVVKMADREGLYGGRVCEPCCDAIAAAMLDICAEGSDDPWDALDARYALRAGGAS